MQVIMNIKMLLECQAKWVSCKKKKNNEKKMTMKQMKY